MSAASRLVLAINAGSSSVKCALFTFDSEPQSVARTTIDGPPSSSIGRILDWVDKSAREPLAAIGHRFVHGGAHYSEPQRITTAVLADLRRLTRFAPNHLPDEIGLVEAFQQHRKDVAQVACFDTAFHRDLPAVARRLPISVELDAQGIRRYGFHGLSYQFLTEELERAGGAEVSGGRVILAHLGNGSSLAALRGLRSVDTTMAFTPIGGVVMSTRSGDLDPGVVTYLARTQDLSPDQVEHLLSHRSGLLGISGVSGDMRTLLEREESNTACHLAVAVYVYAVKKAIGAFVAALGGLDTLVFSGGIGEHSPIVRARICDGLECFGVRLEPQLNSDNAAIISGSGAPIVVRVMPTNEELVIARAVYQLLT